MSLPPELTSSILFRLPVDSLLRFRCISKSFCAEIDDPNFIKTHLKKTMETNSNQGMIFVTDVCPDSIYSLTFDSPDRFVELDYPLKIDSILGDNIKKDGFLDAKNIRTVGSCDGLLCFSNAIGRFALINPSTRKFQILPFLPLHLEHKIEKKSGCNSWTFGFGYDPIGDDYKIVRLGQSIGHSGGVYNSETMIYNLKSNSWRCIPGMPYILGPDVTMGMLLGYDLHWIAGRDRVLPTPNAFVIVAFNLGTEKFMEIPEPELRGGEESPFIIIGNVGKWLSLTVVYDMRIEILVMKVYGVKESWTKLVSVPPNFIPDFQCVRRSHFFKNSKDEFLIGMQGSNPVWYNLKKKTVKILVMPDLGTMYATEFFHGSLVPLNTSYTKETSSEKVSSKGKEKKKMNRDDFLSKGFKLKL